MNKAQKKALKKYESNKRFVENTKNIPIGILSAIARQQDLLYSVIYARQDSKLFGS